MAIDFGKGIRGFLGRVPTIDYQYTPIPFREMLLAGQLADRSQQRNTQLKDNVNKLYRQNLLPKARNVYDQKFDAFNQRVGDYITQNGSNLSGLSGILNDEAFNIQNDRTLLTESNNYKVREDYINTLQQKVTDPDLRPYYLNVSDAQYGQTELGTNYNPMLDYSRLNEEKLMDELYTVAGKLKSETFVDRIDDQGTQTIQTTKTGVSADDIRSTLYNHINESESLTGYIRDKAAALGVTGQEYIDGKVNNIAAQLEQRGDVSLGKRTADPLAGASSDNQYTFTGLIYNAPTEAYFGTDKAQNIIQNYKNNAENMTLSERVSKGSIINNITREAGLSLEDLKTVEKNSVETLVNSKVPENISMLTAGEGFKPITGLRREATKETPHYKFEEAAKEYFKKATIIPEYKQFADKTINPEQKAAINALNAAEQFQNLLTINQTKTDRTWEDASGKTFDNVDNLKISAISTRPYYDEVSNNYYVKVMGTFESGKDTKDTKEFDGMLPLESVLKANSGLNTIYGSPAMVEASRLMIVGQTVSGESFKNYTKQLVEKDPSLADVLSNNVLGVRLNEDRTHSIVVVSPNGKLISAIDDEALTNIKTLTDLIKNLDKKLKQ
tara:strand:- start:357 stop:2195 length:1839 start_codon:yes stop_codon:yes gene_type:complete